MYSKTFKRLPLNLIDCYTKRYFYQICYTVKFQLLQNEKYDESVIFQILFMLW